MQYFEKIEHSELSDSARLALPLDAAVGTKMMIAKALMPMVPADLVATLYYLSFDSQAGIAKAARKSLAELPDHLILPILQDRKTQPKILAYFGLSVMGRDAVVQAVALNPNTSDPVFTEMARRCKNERLIDIFANNQSRLLRYPHLIDALAKNAMTPRSTAERIIQFYFLQMGHDYREDLAQPAVPEVEEAQPEPVVEPEETSAVAEDTDEDLAEGYDEEVLEDDDDDVLPADELPADFSVRDLLKENYDVHELFESHLIVDPESELTSEKRENLENKIRKMDVVTKMRLALKGNIEARNILMKSPNKMIQECVLMNTKITIDEINRYSRNKSFREELIRLIATNRDWTRHYGIRLNLIYNPKTPMTIALKWIPLMIAKDLEKLAKSKQVPGMLAVSARKALANKKRYS